MQVFEKLLKSPFFKPGLNQLSVTDMDTYKTRSGAKHHIKAIVFNEPRIPLYSYGLIFLPDGSTVQAIWTNQGRCFANDDIHYERYDLVPTGPFIN
jgi:hypothetical protein